MGLFRRKQNQNSNRETVDDVPQKVQETVFDEDYRRELQEAGHRQLKQVIGASAANFKQDLNTTISQINGELKDYMTRRLDATISHVDSELSRRLDSRLKEYDRVTKDAHDLAVQSLNRSAQALHEQYQHFNSALKESIASQEVMMISVYEDNKSQILKSQQAQTSALESLQASIKQSDEQRQQMKSNLDDSLSSQEEMLSQTFKQSQARIDATKQAQEAALKSLNQSAQALREQYEQLSTTLDKNIADQEKIMVDAFQDNMARVVEHYLLGALGDQYDIKAQLPSIIQQLEDNKQTIVDDIKL